MLWYQQRGSQGLHLLLYHTAAGPKQSSQFITWLNTTGKYKLQQLGEFEVSDAGLCLCAVHDTLVQEASLAGQKPGKGRGYFCAKLSSGASFPLAVLFHLHSQACPVNEPLSESGHSSEDGQNGEKGSAVEMYYLLIPDQDHTHCRLHRAVLTWSHCMVPRAERN